MRLTKILPSVFIGFTLFGERLHAQPLPPPEASASEVFAGTVSGKFISPKSLGNSGIVAGGATNGIQQSSGIGTNTTIKNLDLANASGGASIQARVYGNSTWNIGQLAFTNGVISGMSGQEIQFGANAYSATLVTNVFGLKALLGPSMFTGTTNLNNLQLFDRGAGIIVSNGFNTSASITMTNCKLSNVSITNVAQGFQNVSVIGGHTNYASSSYSPSMEFDNVVIESPSFGMYFHNDLTQRGQLHANNCRFYAGNIAAGLWYVDSFWKNCVFDTSKLGSSQAAVADYSIAFEGNDYSTNTFWGCQFNYGGSVVETVGFIDYAVSRNTFYDCRFNCVTNASTIQTAILIGENTPHAIFNNCTFNLRAGLLIDLYNSAAADGTLYFNNCFLDPYTNGIVYRRQVSEEPAIYVTGGNLTPANFGNATNVHFIVPVRAYAQLVGQSALTGVNLGTTVLSAYTTSETNGYIAANATLGSITNIDAGKYQVTLSVAARGNVNSFSFFIRTNLVNTHLKLGPFDVTSAMLNFNVNGILDLPANCRVDATTFNDACDVTTRILTLSKF